MYVSQKSVFMNVIDLSQILIKNKNESIDYEDNSLRIKTEPTSEIDEHSQLDQSRVGKDNDDNPLGIVIEPSSPKTIEKTLPKIIELEDPLVNQQNEFPVNKIEIEMNK